MIQIFLKSTPTIQGALPHTPKKMSRGNPVESPAVSWSPCSQLLLIHIRSKYKLPCSCSISSISTSLLKGSCFFRLFITSIFTATLRMITMRFCWQSTQSLETGPISTWSQLEGLDPTAPHQSCQHLLSKHFAPIATMFFAECCILQTNAVFWSIDTNIHPDFFLFGDPPSRCPVTTKCRPSGWLLQPPDLVNSRHVLTPNFV